MSENNEKFPKGLICKRHQNAPDFVVCSLSIKREEFMQWLHDLRVDGEWVNLKINKQKADPTKLFAVIDDWKPERKSEQYPESNIVETKTSSDENSDLPF